VSSGSSFCHSHVNTPVPGSSLPRNDEFPSHLLCPVVMGEPPINEVTFDIPDRHGNVSTQVFEESYLYRHIATTEVGRAFRNIRHPLTGAMICHDIALSFITRVSPELQERMNSEWHRRGLSLVEDSPL